VRSDGVAKRIKRLPYAGRTCRTGSQLQHALHACTVSKTDKEIHNLLITMFH
jgi:hypothetical protein